MAAAAAIGGPAALSVLGGGTAASGIAGAGAGLLGASDATAALAGDAFMPAALGAAGDGAPSAGSLLGSKFASGGGIGGRNLLKGAMGAQKLGLLGTQSSPPPSMPPIPSIAPQATQLYKPGLPSVGGSGMPSAPPGVDPVKWLAYLQSQGGQA